MFFNCVLRELGVVPEQPSRDLVEVLQMVSMADDSKYVAENRKETYNNSCTVRGHGTYCGCCKKTFIGFNR